MKITCNSAWGTWNNITPFRSSLIGIECMFKEIPFIIKLFQMICLAWRERNSNLSCSQQPFALESNLTHRGTCATLQWILTFSVYPTVCLGSCIFLHGRHTVFMSLSISSSQHSLSLSLPFPLVYCHELWFASLLLSLLFPSSFTDSSKTDT